MLRCPTTSNVLTNRERLLAEGFSFHAIILCAVQKPRLHTELACQRGRSVFASVVLLQDVVFSSDAYKPLSVVSTLARGTNRTSNVSRRNHPPRSSVHFWPFSVGYIFMDRLYMCGGLGNPSDVAVAEFWRGFLVSDQSDELCVDLEWRWPKPGWQNSR